MLTYENFRDKIQQALKESGPLTWTEIRTSANLPEKFPNNRWVHRLETDIGLKRNRDAHGIIKWALSGVDYAHATDKPPEPTKRSGQTTGRE
jgi:hypothetical protein